MGSSSSIPIASIQPMSLSDPKILNSARNQIEYLNCTHDDYPCKLFFSNEKLKDLYEKKLSFNEFKIFSKKNKFLKLTSYNRNFIKKQKLQPENNSIMHYLLNL